MGAGDWGFCAGGGRGTGFFVAGGGLDGGPLLAGVDANRVCGFTAGGTGFLAGAFCLLKLARSLTG